MKIILTLLFMCGVMFASEKKVNQYYQELQTLSKQQVVDMMFAYAKGLPHDLGLTLAAIAWKESNFNTIPVNVTDGKYGSYGMYHVMLDYAAKRHGAKSSFTKNKLAARLLNDKHFASEEAIRVLRSFASKRCNLHCQIASYNGGTRGLAIPRARAYAEDIKLRVKALDKLFSERGYYVRIAAIVLEVNGCILPECKLTNTKLAAYIPDEE